MQPPWIVEDLVPKEHSAMQVNRGSWAVDFATQRSVHHRGGVTGLFLGNSVENWVVCGRKPSDMDLLLVSEDSSSETEPLRGCLLSLDQSWVYRIVCVYSKGGQANTIAERLSLMRICS